MSEPIWIAAARQHIGLREIPGAPTEPKIAGWLKKLGAWWADDSTPWCGTFVAAVMQSCSIPHAKAWYRAKAWLEWGQRVMYPALGAVVVFDRTGGGHVAIIVGQDNNGRLLCIGGNQGDAVSIAPFDRSRVLGYRWPPGEPLPVIATLPIFASTAKASSNEA
jgi:uncharacterized protein (TIGR02594 family)